MNLKKFAFLFSVFVSHQVFALSPAVPVLGSEFIPAGNCDEFAQFFAVQDAKEPLSWDYLSPQHYQYYNLANRIVCLKKFDASLRNRLLLTTSDIELIKTWNATAGDLNEVRTSERTITSNAIQFNNIDFLKWLKFKDIKPLEATDLANELTAATRRMLLFERGGSINFYQRQPVKIYDWLIANNYNWPTTTSIAHELLYNLSEGYFKKEFTDACQMFKKMGVTKKIIAYEELKLHKTNSDKRYEYDSPQKYLNHGLSIFFISKVRTCDLSPRPE